MNAYVFPVINSKQLSLESIAESIANQLGIDVCLLQEKTRRREVVSKRQISMYLLRIHGFTHHNIGTFFCKDHSTVIHSVKTIDREMEYDKQLHAMIKAMQPLNNTNG